MRWIATTGAVLVLGTTLAACGGGGGGKAKAGAAAAKTTTTAAGTLTGAQLREKTEARCVAFTREVLAEPLPEKNGEYDRWSDAIRRMERRLVADLRALKPPRDQAAAYRKALDARERSLRKKSPTMQDIERSASGLARFSPHACRYWGVRVFGKDGLQFQNDQSSYCFEESLKIEAATKRVRRGREPVAAVESVAKTLESSARLMDVEPPGDGAEKRWEELRAAVDDLGETVARLPSLDTQAKADAYNEDVSSALSRAGSATWTLGIGSCDFSDPLNDFVGAIEARDAREEAPPGEAA